MCPTTAPNTERPFVVIAINGTFAPRASWAKAGSFLHRALLTYLPNPSLFWETFSWSGANSHQGRLDASSRLRSKIFEVVNTHPDAKIYLLAHSHGGNVALMALSTDFRLRDVVAGVICLSTPFIRARKRDIGQAIGSIEALLAYWWFVMVLAIPGCLGALLAGITNSKYMAYVALPIGYVLNKLHSTLEESIPLWREDMYSAQLRQASASSNGISG